MNNYVYDVFAYLHEHPEKGFEEYETSKYIESCLKNIGYTVKKVGKTALIAELDTHVNGTSLAIRCDMDALEFMKDKEQIYVHACGHDANSSIALACAKEIFEKGIKRGKLKFIFQAAEETGLGAMEIIESGEVDDVEEMIGMHLRPLADTKLGEATCAVMHNASCRMVFRLLGKAAHAARPHLGINVIEMGTTLINGLSSIHINPEKPFSIKATQFNTVGNSPNTIPYQADMTIDIRAADNECMVKAKKQLQILIKSVEEFYESNVEILSDNAMPGPDYDPNLTKLAEECITKVLGSCNPPYCTAGSEDFHKFKLIKNIKTAYIGLGADLLPGLHDMDMHFDKKCLEYGVQILSEFILKKLS